MEFTGERFVPEVQGNIELEHLHRYLQACELVSGQVVLDIASGEGYGSAILAGRAAKVLGVDISEEAVTHARNRYVRDNLEFLVGNCTSIPLPDASVDVVVSFETIEHHDQHELMFQDIKRVLKPAGLLLISSPDKYNYSDEPGFTNSYHVKELYQHEFKQLLNTHFANAVYYGQRVVYGSVIFSESGKAESITYSKEEGVVKLTPGLAKPTFWIALASNGALPDLAVGLFEQPIEDSEMHRWKDNELLTATNLLRIKDEHLETAADLLRIKDEHLETAADLLRQKDEHLATAAELIRERDELLALANAKLARSIQLPWKLPWKK